MNLREKVAEAIIAEIHSPETDRAIAAVFDHLENVTDEMAEAGDNAHDEGGSYVETFRAMLAAARKEAEK